MIRGAVYRVDLGSPRGHEQGGRRYGVVISPSEMPWTVATVVPTSTRASAAAFRPEVEICGERTVLLVDQIRSVDVERLVGEPVDFLHHSDLTALETATISYLGLG